MYTPNEGILGGIPGGRRSGLIGGIWRRMTQLVLTRRPPKSMIPARADSRYPLRHEAIEVLL